MNRSLDVASVAAALAWSTLGRLVYLRWRGAREEEFRSAHGLDDPRSRNELRFAGMERRLLLFAGIPALVIAMTSGLVGFVMLMAR